MRNMRYPPAFEPRVDRALAVLHVAEFGMTSERFFFSQDGMMVLEVGYEVVRAWSVADGRLLCILDGQSEPFLAVVPRGSRLLFSSGTKPSLAAWDIATGKMAWGLDVGKQPTHKENPIMAGKEVSKAHSTPTHVKAPALDLPITLFQKEWKDLILPDVKIRQKEREIHFLDVGYGPDRLVMQIGGQRKALDVNKREFVSLQPGEDAILDAREAASRVRKRLKDGSFLYSERVGDHVFIRERQNILIVDALTGAVESVIQYQCEYPVPNRSHGRGFNIAIPTPDGQHLITSSDEAALRLWEIPTGRLVRVFKWESHPIKFVQVTADGRRVGASAEYLMDLRVWDVGTGEPVLDIPRQAAVKAVLHLPGTDTVAAALSSGEIRVVDVTTGDLVATWRGHDGGVNDLALVSGRGLVVSGGEDGTVVAWNVETGEAVRRFAGHSHPVKKIAASPRGDLVAAGLENGTTWIWSIETGERLHVLDDYEERVTTLAFFPDGERLLSAGLEGMMRFWHARSGNQLGEVERYGTFPYGVVFTDDGKHILACFNDVDQVPRNPIAVIDATSYKHVRNIFPDNPHAINYPVLRLGSTPREHLLAGTDDYWIRVHALKEEKEVRSFRCRNVPNSLAFIPGKPWLVSGDEGGDLVVWDLGAGTPPGA